MILRHAVLFLAIATFDGTWVFQYNGQNILKLTLTTHRGDTTGSLTKPAMLNINQDGDVTRLGPQQVTLPVQHARLLAGALELRNGGDAFTITVQDHDHATLQLEGMRPVPLLRVPARQSVVLAAELREPDYPPDIRALRERLAAMVKKDQDTRLNFSQERMEAVDEQNRPELLRIFDRYGWVTNSLAGRDAAHNFWLLVQHQTPEIQRRLLPELEKAARSENASMTDYAYLYDRVQVGLGKPQHWGSQTACENGKPVLAPVDDPSGLDERRKELFLPPISEYLKMDYLVKSCSLMPK